MPEPWSKENIKEKYVVYYTFWSFENFFLSYTWNGYGVLYHKWRSRVWNYVNYWVVNQFKYIKWNIHWTGYVVLLTVEIATVEHIYLENNPEGCKTMLIIAFCRYSPKCYIQVNDLEGPQRAGRSSVRCFPNYSSIIMTQPIQSQTFLSLVPSTWHIDINMQFSNFILSISSLAPPLSPVHILECLFTYSLMHLFISL